MDKAMRAGEYSGHGYDNEPTRAHSFVLLAICLPLVAAVTAGFSSGTGEGAVSRRQFATEVIDRCPAAAGAATRALADDRITGAEMLAIRAAVASAASAGTHDCAAMRRGRA